MDTWWQSIKDVWMICLEDPRQVVPAGTTVRFCDPRIGAWRSTWIFPTQGVVQTFIGRKIGDEIVLEKTSEGQPEKWIFSLINPQSFRWRSLEMPDNDSPWQLTEEMQVRRRS